MKHDLWCYLFILHNCNGQSALTMNGIHSLALVEETSQNRNEPKELNGKLKLIVWFRIKIRDKINNKNLFETWIGCETRFVAPFQNLEWYSCE